MSEKREDDLVIDSGQLLTHLENIGVLPQIIYKK